jgi:hypothetical protein
MTLAPPALRSPLVAARYAPSDRVEWDEFIAASKNGTFLLTRGYMEYHSDRFVDHSLVVRDEAGRCVAVFPADRRGEVVRSHGGLTYGGVVSDAAMSVARMGAVFAALAAALRDGGVVEVVYKTVPRIYHTLPADEDAYWLFRHRAQLYRRDVLTAFEHAARGPVQERRRRAARRAAAGGLKARWSDDWDAFWAVLSDNLRERYAVAPVHTLDEIRTLAARFPESIRLVGTYDGARLLGGAVAYVTPTVCHVQYNAASPEGKDRGALDLALEFLAVEVRGRRWFDFGASTEGDGRVLNAGLVAYKEGFGARTVVHDTYRWRLDAAREPE